MVDTKKKNDVQELRLKEPDVINLGEREWETQDQSKPDTLSNRPLTFHLSLCQTP